MQDDSESTQLIDGFMRSNKVLVAQITGANSTYSRADCTRMIKALQDELERVCDELMSIELRQVEKYELLIDEFDTRLNEAKTAAIDMQQLFFRQVEEQEDKFTGAVRAVITDLMERLAREELAEDYLDDEAMGLVVDRETCMGILGASHDMHVTRILKREDEARNTETKRYAERIHGNRNAERARNRNRVLQIHDFSRSSKLNLQALLAVDEGEEEEDEK